eukprot:7304483-Ditylum_brightwellii.AAC.1
MAGGRKRWWRAPLLPSCAWRASSLLPQTSAVVVMRRKRRLAPVWHGERVLRLLVFVSLVTSNVVCAEEACGDLPL